MGRPAGKATGLGQQQTQRYMQQLPTNANSILRGGGFQGSASSGNSRSVPVKFASLAPFSVFAPKPADASASMTARTINANAAPLAQIKLKDEDKHNRSG